MALPVAFSVVRQFMKTLWSDDMDDHGDKALQSDARDVLESFLRSCSRTLQEGRPDGA